MISSVSRVTIGNCDFFLAALFLFVALEIGSWKLKCRFVEIDFVCMKGGEVTSEVRYEHGKVKVVSELGSVSIDRSD